MSSDDKTEGFRVEFPIPLLRDSDGQPHPIRAWDALTKGLLPITGGDYSSTLIEGSWHGIPDESRLYSILVPTESEVEQIRALADELAITFDQQAILLVVAPVTYELRKRPQT